MLDLEKLAQVKDPLVAMALCLKEAFSPRCEEGDQVDARLRGLRR